MGLPPITVEKISYVIDSGLVTMSGDAKQMLDDPKVRAAYRGE